MKIQEMIDNEDMRFEIKRINLLIIKNTNASISFENRCEQWQKIMNEKKLFLEKYHMYSIPTVPSSDGRFHSYIPNKEAKSKRKSIAAKSYDELINKLYDYYTKSKTILFEDLYFSWVKSQDEEFHRSSITIRKYKTDYKRFIDGTDFGSKDITEINEKDITNLLIINANGSKYGSESVNHQLKVSAVTNFSCALRQAFEYAYVERLIDENPMNRVRMNLIKQQCDRTEKPEIKKYYTDNEFNLIKQDIHKKQEENPNYLANFACDFVIMTGARVGEVAALKWSSVNLEEGYIDFQNSESKVIDINGKTTFNTLNRTKTGKTRYLKYLKNLMIY